MDMHDPETYNRNNQWHSAKDFQTMKFTTSLNTNTKQFEKSIATLNYEEC
jgi:hypothetical protein